MRRVLRLLIVPGLAGALSAGCSNNIEPISGALNVSLSSPHEDDGAVLVSISGGPIDSVESTGYRIYSARAAADTVKLIVTGRLTSGTIARLHIPDSKYATAYVAQVAQVAARRTFTQHDPRDYTLTLLP